MVALHEDITRGIDKTKDEQESSSLLSAYTKKVAFLGVCGAGRNTDLYRKPVFIFMLIIIFHMPLFRCIAQTSGTYTEGKGKVALLTL